VRVFDFFRKTLPILLGCAGCAGLLGCVGSVGLLGCCVCWPLHGAVELAVGDVMDLHPSFDGEAFVSIVGVVVEEPSVARTEHVLSHFLWHAIGGEFGSVSFSRFHWGDVISEKRMLSRCQDWRCQIVLVSFAPPYIGAHDTMTLAPLTPVDTT